MSSEEKCDAKDKPKDENVEIADFEKAIDSAGYGWFNVYLFLVAVPVMFAANFETSSMSYILPVAECDLKLSLQDKGILNAATYAGLIISAIFLGYLADTQGRKKLLIICHFGDTICVMASALSQNMWMLVVFKFLGGIMINGPGAIFYTYVTEMHGAKHRPRSMMFAGMISYLGTLTLPILAWAVFPRPWEFTLFDYLEIHPWQIFLVVVGLPSLIGGIAMLFLPESPKFSMSNGRNAKALRTFQKIYALNTGKPKHEYPVKQLVEEVSSREKPVSEVIFTIEPNKPVIEPEKPQLLHRRFSESVRDGMEQMKPLFRKPLIGKAIHVYTLQFCILLALNTIRLWLPQIFASFSEFENLSTSTGESGDLCSILEYSVNKTKSLLENYEEHCDKSNRPVVSIDMYINNIIVAITGIIGYGVGGFVVRFTGGKRLMNIALFMSSCLGFSLYWSFNSISTLAISAIYLSVSSIGTMSLLNETASLFPTSLRTVMVATSLMFGRLGALTGNLLFPVLMEIGCVPPFLMVGFTMLCACGLSILLPSTKKLTFK